MGREKLLRIIIPKYPALNIYSAIANKTTALGPVYIASIVNELPGWRAEVVDENNFNERAYKNKQGRVDHFKLQKEDPADVVGFYCGLTSTISRVYELSKLYSQMGVITLAAGQHFSKETIPEGFENSIDCIILGEGELTIKELLPVLDKDKRYWKEIKGIVYLDKGNIIYTPSREPITDFSFLPTPHFSLVRSANIVIFPINRIRGCGMDCEFCTVRGKPRAAKPEKIFKDIVYLAEKENARHFFIVDDLFGQHRQDSLYFCSLIEDYQKKSKKKLDFTVQIRLDRAKDKELLNAMQRMGVRAVAIGFESPIEVELKAMNKRIKAEDMVKLARVYHDYGFLVHGMFIFCYPILNQDKLPISIEEKVNAYLKFIRKAKIDTIQILLPVPLPGTELRERLKQENRIYPLSWEFYDGSFPLFEFSDNQETDKIHFAAWKIMSKFYNIGQPFLVLLNLILLPVWIVLIPFKVYKPWWRPIRNSVLRTIGFLILLRWTFMFRRSSFKNKLKSVKDLSQKNKK